MQVSLCEFHMKSDIASGQSVGHFSFAQKKRHRISAFTAKAEFYLKRLSFLLNQPFVPADRFVRLKAKMRMTKSHKSDEFNGLLIQTRR